MKKVYTLISDFCIPEKRYCFQVRVVMQTVEPGIENNKTGSHIFIWLSPQKAQKTPYRNSYFIAARCR